MSDINYPDALPSQYRLHWYVLERVLGQGGFGITYLARDTNLDQPVAVKEYLPVDVATRRADATVRPRTDDQAERYRWGLDRFIREARTLARFDHANIVRVHSVFEFNNTAYMVMRFEEGENLAARLERRRTLPEDELMRVLLPILDGLELVHGAGFIHRDVKPDNIHIRADGSPVLLDFGSARHALGQARTVTILVAPGYAPFEQYYSSGENQGPWTDIYGLGATCYRAIAGVPPMDAIARSKGILGSTREILVPARAIGAGRYSERLLRAVDHALEFAEKDRPQTIAEWRKELFDGAAATQSGAGVSAWAKKSEPPAVPRSAAPAPATKVAVLWAAFGAAVTAVAAAAVIAWLQPAGEHKRLADLERQLEGQRQRDELRQKEEQKLKEELRAQQQRELELQKQRELETRKQKELEAQQQADLQRQREHEGRKPKERPREQAAQRRAREPEKNEAPGRPIASAAPSTAAESRSNAPGRDSSTTMTSARSASRGPDTEVARAAPQPAAPVPPAQVAVLPPQPAVTTPVSPAAVLAPAAPRESSSAPAKRTPESSPPADDAAAAAFYHERALKGDSEAQLRLGDLYASGRGVVQSNNQAYVWYGLAARGGNAEAKTKQQQIAAKLQPAEIRQADRLIERRTATSK